ncbi:MAG: hypothetical protein FJX94_01355 [Bacteroidetes bacterium]|nr:hypothetical protein [Bacteroidota bacterium]
MNRQLLDLYREENNSWKSTLELQRNQIPGMSRVLSEIVKDNPGEQYLNNARHLQRKLEEQEADILRLTARIDALQCKLDQECEKKEEQYRSFETLYMQEELRDLVLKFEKMFIDFKQSFHHYLLTMI